MDYFIHTQLNPITHIHSSLYLRLLNLHLCALEPTVPCVLLVDLDWVVALLVGKDCLRLEFFLVGNIIILVIVFGEVDESAFGRADRDHILK